jgi:hypothetical protein
MKNGLNTSEFWVILVVAILSVVSPTLINYFGSEDALPDWAKLASVLAGSALSVFAALGYAKGRVELKKEEIKAGGGSKPTIEAK